jgi:hypothetical protein
VLCNPQTPEGFVTHELRPDGSNILVAEHNKQEYIVLMFKYVHCLTVKTRQQMPNGAGLMIFCSCIVQASNA